jgi:hypothetical protein
MKEEPSTGIRKRQQIASTGKQMMFYVAGAAAVITICVMLAINFSQHISYQLKVNKEWGNTNKSLDESIANIPTLRDEVTGLSADNNIQSIGKLADGLEKWQVVFDVLPSSCDSMAVEYSFSNKIFQPSGLGAYVKDASAAMEGGNCAALSSSSSESSTDTSADNSMKPQPVLMAVSFELVSATDEDIRKALSSMEYSLHPITVSSIEITSDDVGGRSAKISVVTYFVPRAGWQAGEKTVPVDENASDANSGGEETTK